MFTNKFPWTPENPERERRQASVCVTSESSFRRAMHAHPHSLAEESCMNVYPRTHEHTWLHNNMPYFLCNLKSPFSLLISPSQYACAHASIANIHACTQTHIACYPPKHSQHVNPAWKLETGHVPWQPHPDFEPVR